MKRVMRKVEDMGTMLAVKAMVMKERVVNFGKDESGDIPINAIIWIVISLIVTVTIFKDSIVSIANTFASDLSTWWTAIKGGIFKTS